MDLDSFFVSVERRIDSRLNGRPMLIGGASGRSVVAACSYETRMFGVRSGMPMQMARRLCPEALVMRGNSEAYSECSREVTDVIQADVPIMEKASIDEFYADLSGMDRFFDTLRFASELRQKVIHETGLPISLGLSSNKTVAKVATGEAKPDNEQHVPSGQERDFLKPLSIRKIPMVGEKTYQTLRNLGIQHIGTLQDMPVEMLCGVMGNRGQTLWRKAHGLDDSPVLPHREQKSMSSEQTFNEDSDDIAGLQRILSAMTEGLAFRLRQRGNLTGCVTVKIRYADFQTFSKQASLAYTGMDQVLIPKASALFDRLLDRRVRIRLIAVKFSDLVSGGEQCSLFDDGGQQKALRNALDDLRGRYGKSAVGWAFGMGHHLDEFSLENQRISPHREFL